MKPQCAGRLAQHVQESWGHDEPLAYCLRKAPKHSLSQPIQPSTKRTCIHIRRHLPGLQPIGGAALAHVQAPAQQQRLHTHDAWKGGEVS